jgi:hypothetical protein
VRVAILAPLLAAMLAVTGTAAAASDRVPITGMKVHRAAEGPHAGAIVVVFHANLRHVLEEAPDHSDHYEAVATVSSDGVSVRGTDHARLHARAHRGARASFHIVIPPVRAARLDGAERVDVRVRFREAGPRSGRAVGPAARQFIPGVGGCSLFLGCVLIPSSPPAAPVGFEVTVKSVTASFCVGFRGPGFAEPRITSGIWIHDPKNGTNFIFNDGNVSWPVDAATGSYSGPGWIQSAGPARATTLSGTVPLGFLSAAPDASMGTATLAYSGPKYLNYPQSYALPYAPQHAC